MKFERGFDEGIIGTHGNVEHDTVEIFADWGGDASVTLEIEYDIDLTAENIEAGLHLTGVYVWGVDATYSPQVPWNDLKSLLLSGNESIFVSEVPSCFIR